MECGDSSPLSFSRTEGGSEGVGNSARFESQSDDKSSHSKVLRQKKSFSRRNARKSFDIGRSVASKFDVNRLLVKEKASVAATPQQTRNKTATRRNKNDQGQRLGANGADRIVDSFAGFF